MIRFACVVGALLLASSTPAFAQLRAVSDGPAPVLEGDRVLWGERSGESVQFLSAPVSGGAATPFGSLTVPRRDVMWLAASPGLLAVQLRDGGSPSAPGRLYVAGADGAFRLLADDVGEEPFDPLWPPLSVTSGGVFTQEAVPLVRGLSGERTEVVVPPESNAGFVAAAGDVGVASTDGALIVFDLRSGTELHQISLEGYDAQVTSLAVSPDGDVAATTAVGDGSDVLLYAPAGASRVRALAREVRMETVATAGGRVAYVGSNRLDAGVRVTVLDGASGARLFRGPVSADAERLSFDGTHLAWTTGGCTLLAAVPTAAVGVVPSGPCVRTEASVARMEGARVEVTCLSAPTSSCRVRAAGRTARVRVGRTKTIRLPRGATVRVIDPDGRTRTVLPA
ncbi:WD40 repeat domain-containing protein [Solirubrobacter soli]|uniref:WD40 repeat domain-containing protein n=1 Tax=Solirubrobacter soli TaxID=363832 RepID=UPI000417938D|nr:WD40 repeat domain-containing protein [Solirubrobacter soli]